MESQWTTRTLSLLLLLLYCSETPMGCFFDYFAVQPYPITFQTEPESQVLALGERLTLTCRANVSLLNGVDEYLYRMPTISWRLNGSELTNGDSWSITTDENIGHSTFLVENVSRHQAGEYECLVNDANGHFITVSRKAVVQVIENVVHQLSVELSQPVQLECGALVPVGMGVTWRHNGQAIQPSDDAIITVDGGRTLLLVSADYEDNGLWKCVGVVLEGKNLPETQYNVTVTSGDYSGLPHIVFNTSQSTPEDGMPFTLQCLIAPDMSATVVWLDEGQKASGLAHEMPLAESQDLSFEAFTINDAGSYTCAVVDMNGSIIAEATIDLHLSAEPEFVIKPVTEMYISKEAESLELTCTASGHPTPTIYWVKDGISLSMSLYNHSTGSLSVAPANVSGNLHGVYQCFAENSAGLRATVTRVLIANLSNPPTDLICVPTTSEVMFGLFKPHIEMTWNPPIPDGGTERTYRVEARNSDLDLIHKQKAKFTHYTLPLDLDGVYEVFVFVEGSDSCAPLITCTVDTTDQFEINPKFIRPTCQFGTVHLEWEAPTFNPSTYPVNNFRVTTSCLHGNDSQFYDETYSRMNIFNKDILTGLPSGALCLITGSFTLATSTSIFEELYTIPTSNCIVDGDPVVDKAIPGNPRLNITCESSTVWLAWDIPHPTCLDVDHINISGECLNETWTQKYNQKVDTIDVAGGVLTFSSILTGSVCSFTGFFFNENSTVEVIAPVQCLMDTYSPATYRVWDQNFTKTRNDCKAESEGARAVTLATPTSKENSTSDMTNTMEGPSTTNELSTTNESTAAMVTITEDAVPVLIAMLVLMSIILPCSLAGILLVVMILYQRKRRSKRNLLEMEVSAYRSTIKWSSHYDDTTSVKTELDAMFPNEFFQEIPALGAIPVYDFTIMDQFELPLRQQQEEAADTASSFGKSELDPEDMVSLDPTERWSSPIEKRPADDSGCFLVTDKNGLSKAVSKQEIPVDRTGSSGFWSDSSSPQNDMQSYHDSIQHDLAEAECDEKNEPSLLRGKVVASEGGSTSSINTNGQTFARVKDGHALTHQLRGLSEVTSRTSVSCIVVETDSGTCIRVTMDQNRSPKMSTIIPAPMHRYTDAENVKEVSDSQSLGSSMETLSQSSGSNEYINHPRHCQDGQDSSEAHNVSNLLYTDGKGYLRFVTKSGAVSVPVLTK